MSRSDRKAVTARDQKRTGRICVEHGGEGFARERCGGGYIKKYYPTAVKADGEGKAEGKTPREWRQREPFFLSLLFRPRGRTGKEKKRKERGP